MNDIPVVILCGGMGMRLKEETEFRPKPMVEIGEHPILWHIMTSYANFGFTRFILCLGFRANVIKDYFLNYNLRTCDSEVTLGITPQVKILNRHAVENWKVVLADTGLSTMTGGRVKRIERYIDTDNFMLTYGDAVSDVNVAELYRFHLQHGKVATVTGVRPPSRFGELEAVGTNVNSFTEKPVRGGFINGGFFVFNRKIFDYVDSTESCILEQTPLETLARNGELQMWAHEGFWQCMDTIRDVMHLRAIAEQKNVPWHATQTAGTVRQ